MNVFHTLKYLNAHSIHINMISTRRRIQVDSLLKFFSGNVLIFFRYIRYFLYKSIVFFRITILKNSNKFFSSYRVEAIKKLS